MIETILETTVIDDINDKKCVLNALCDFDNEDFNGNNGDEYTWDDALDNGFNSTQEYIVDKLEKDEKITTTECIEEYLDSLYGQDSYYYSYDYVLTRINDTNTYVLSVMAVID